ncbi:DUF5686 and carboxypeptidase regulatory-like domain-containing protein [Mangrovimonas xylaniphaga]|uniref:DUF5686 and carboxypeptidase regulatory-like domain-containing protein n=1 Tax=Mangrovimonas xylaniphaga TaxID=1645915 RepID=UPI0006B562E0|nr:DUF5686 and carboxypeptidase regulatory-like domain-containing protein [Mangrovimonas xylaniphaga]
MKQKLVLLFSFLQTFYALAQIQGTVKDSNNTPLAFVNIYIENTYTGTTSNDNGVYELNVSAPKTYTITFKYLGYKTLKKTVAIENFPYQLDVILQEEEISLQEVVVKTNENPANKIMRATIDKRKENLELIKAFNAHYYSRGLLKIKNAPKAILGQELGDLGGGLDSTRSGIIYLSETVSKIDYLYPNKLKETIIASKVSGDDNGFSFNTAMDANFNFYNNTIDLENPLISPIAEYAFNYYRYTLEGIFYDDFGNLINKIKVTPKRKNDRVFEGHMYIVEDQWTIYALELTTTGQQAQIPGADTITLKQNFSYSQQDKVWALMSQNIDFSFGMFGINGEGHYTSVYSDYNFNPEFSKRNFGKEILSFKEEANKKDSLYWEINRPVPLTEEEIQDYLKKDSIQTIKRSKTYLDSTDRVSNKFKFSDIFSGYTFSNSYEKWSLGVSSPLSALNFNTVQGFNSSVGIHHTKNIDEFKRYFFTRATLNYGLGDQRLRGVFSAHYKFNNISRPYLMVSGGVTTQQFNGAEPISKLINSISSLFFEDNYMKLYDKSYAEISFSKELFNGFKLYSNISYERRKPLFNTTDTTFINESDDTYTSNNPLDETAFGIAPFNTHNIFKFNLSATFNFGQEYFSYPDSKYTVIETKYPTLSIGYEKGFGASINAYNFDQLKLRIFQNVELGNKGDFAYNLRAGTFFNAKDIAFMDYQHFNGNQTHVSSSGSYTNVFNNLPYYSLSTNDNYLEFHAEHNFSGYILGKIPMLNKLNYNLIVGAHALSSETYKPYQEYSVGIDNIGWGKFRFLRLDYVRSYQNGFQSDAFIFGLKLFN